MTRIERYQSESRVSLTPALLAGFRVRGGDTLQFVLGPEAVGGCYFGSIQDRLGVGSEQGCHSGTPLRPAVDQAKQRHQ